jgi:hypothetical protein
MRNWFLPSVVLAVAVLAASSLLVAQTTEPIVGTWKVNVAASKYDPGPAPKSNTRTVEDWGGGLFHTTFRGVDGQGNPTWAHYVFKFDGKEYPYAASTLPKTSPVFTTIAFRRIDASTYEAIVKTDGKVTTTNTVTLSKDGKSYTQRQKGTNAQGQPTNNVVVFERQ